MRSTTTKRNGEKPNAGVTPKKTTDTYRLKITLEGIEPPIWRLIEVAGNSSLEQLHEVIQVAMGWTHSHLHQFIIGETYYGIPDDEFEDASETKDERECALSQVINKIGNQFVYQYDFGDNWEHSIVVEDIQPAKKPVRANCLAGGRHCPPEDVGSIPGYDDFLKAIKNPKHPEHAGMLEWAGGSFDPEAFSVEMVNKELVALRRAGCLAALWPGEDDL